MYIKIFDGSSALPDDKTENTSTLVLTTPSGTFIDVRLFLRTTSPTSSLPLPLPLHHPTLVTPSTPTTTLPLTRLDWAFSGTSIRYPLPSDPRKTQCTWHHAISSRFVTPTPENSADKGVMTPQRTISTTDGKAEECQWDLEEGSMLNPDTGRVQEYREAWAEAPALVGEVEPVACEDGRRGVRLHPFEGGEVVADQVDLDARPARLWVVLHTAPSEIISGDDEDETRVQLKGTVIRIGDWAQGLVRSGGFFCVELHMVRSQAKDGTDRKWTKLFRVETEEVGEDGHAVEALNAGVAAALSANVHTLPVGASFPPAKDGIMWVVAEKGKW